ncbi:uncharacterized protein DFL_000050 [Arthrobotrys flagrans]|uniref:Serine/threonine-protein kinase Tel1 n=1 Tax=Arthrobotrys flagrans TaxID=97331 RepID=A0A437AD14_ARTFL|nr:hypothetical protein DFL_000050 [Arthrobotrys flagrans]
MEEEQTKMANTPEDLLINQLFEPRDYSGSDTTFVRNITQNRDAILQRLFTIAFNKLETLKANADGEIGELERPTGAIRRVVEICVTRLHHKVVMRLAKHCARMLEEFHELDDKYNAIVEENIRTLDILFGYRPHREHLRKDGWTDLVELCCRLITARINRQSEYKPTPEAQNPRNAGFGQIGFNSLKLLRKISSTPQVYFGRDKQPNESLDVVLTVYELFPTEIDVILILNSWLELFAAINLEYATKIVVKTMASLARTWEDASSEMKEHLIVHLIFGLPHMHTLLKSPLQKRFRGNLTDLLEIIAKEHRVDHRERFLKIDDISFGCPLPSGSGQRSPLRTSTFALRSCTSKNEQCWMIPQLLASIIYALQQSAKDSAQTVGRGIKRLRVESALDDIIRDLRSKEIPSRILAMQILSFYFGRSFPDSPTMETGIETVAKLCSDEDPQSASWAMIVLAVIYSNPNSGGVVGSLNNLDVWKTAMKNIMSSFKCSSACHLLRIMLSEKVLKVTEVGESINDLILNIEVQGPALIVDSSIAFWHEIAAHCREHSAFLKTPLETRLFQWFLMKWQSRFQLKEAEYISSKAHSFGASVPEVSSIISLCCGQEYYPYLTYPHPTSGTIGRAVQISTVSLNPLSCLFPENTLAEGDSKLEGYSVSKYWTTPATTDGLTEIETRMIAFVSRQLDDLYLEWLAMGQQCIGRVSRAGAASIVDYFAIISIFGASLRQSKPEITDPFFEKLARLQSILGEYFDQEEVGVDVVDDILARINGFVPRLSSYGNDAGVHLLSLTEDNAFTRLLSTLEAVVSSKRQLGEAVESVPGEPYEAMSSPDAARTTLRAALRLHASAAKSKDLKGTREELATSLEDLSPAQLISSRAIINDCLALGRHADLSRDRLGALVKTISNKLLWSEYDHERCEVGVLVCIEILEKLAGLWVGRTRDGLYRCCKSIYGWLRSTSNEYARSYRECMAVARLLGEMCSVNEAERYPKAHLLELLQDEDIRVRDVITSYLPKLLSRSNTDQDSGFYGDAVKHLEAGTDDLEGLAVRVHGLSKLASAPFHVMRKAVFHIFETAWKAPRSKECAARAISNVAKILKSGGRGPKEVFKLFRTHLIHPFLQQSANLDEEFPYSIFGYETLAELYVDAGDELVAQLFLFNRNEDAKRISEILGISYNSLMRKSFHKVVAYSVAWELSRNVGKGTAGERLRGYFGAADYDELTREKLALILSTFFEICSEDDIKELVQKSEENPAWGVMTSIFEVCHLPTKFGHITEPAFEAPIIVNSVNHVCHEMGLGNINTMWDPALYTFIVRRQLDMMQEALGSVQFCIIIRTIRFIVSFAGRVAVEGYPLELAIHGLIPYLADPVCAPDAIGVLVYLFTSGRQYLTTVPNFVLSSSFAIFAPTNTFLPPEVLSSAKKAPIADPKRAVKFTKWFAEYLQSYEPSTIKEDQISVFRSISNAIVDFQNPDSDKALLQSLLHDENSGPKRLLDEAARRTAYATLANSPRLSLLTAEQCAETDQEALALGRTFFRVCRSSPVSDEFLLLSARILGRGFAASGVIYDEWTRESGVKDLLTENSNALREGAASEISLLRLVEACLTSRAKDEVRTAESTIRNIISRDTEGSGSNNIVEEYTSDRIRAAMRWTTVQPPLSPNSVSDIPPRLPELRMDFKTWVRKLAIWLSRNINDDGISASLPPLLSAADGFPEKALPYLLHIALLEQFSSNQKQLKTRISQFFADCFSNPSQCNTAHISILLEAVLYLRTQMVPGEATPCERDDWIKLDYQNVARGAAACGLFKVALMFVEIHVSRTGCDFEDTDFLLKIYENIGDPDSYYGIERPPTLRSVMESSSFENDGWNSLYLEAAFLENHMLNPTAGNPTSGADPGVGTRNALNVIGLNALSFNNSHFQGTTDFQTAWKLEQWDIPCTNSYSINSIGIYKALQSINTQPEIKLVATYLNEPYRACLQHILSPISKRSMFSPCMRTLAMLWETEEVLSATDDTSLHRIYENLYARDKWMETGNSDDVDNIYAARMATCRSLSKRAPLRANSKVEIESARLLEANNLIRMCRMTRSHKMLQKSLVASVSLFEMIDSGRITDVEIEAAAKLENASVLWDMGKSAPAVRMLQPLPGMLEQAGNRSEQAISIKVPELLVKIGAWTAEARLENPDHIMQEYFTKAVRELKNGPVFPADGKVYYEFALFCDRQLQDRENLEEFRVTKELMEKKEQEYLELENPKHAKDPKRRYIARTHLANDRIEYERLYTNRQLLLAKGLESYLKCLIICDGYDSAARFCALWLEHSTDEDANAAVEAGSLAKVESRKFIPMMNQLSSRLLDDESKFQALLSDLIFRICRDHPYHGMYQIIALKRCEFVPHKEDPSVNSRRKVATRIFRELYSDPACCTLAESIHQLAHYFTLFANEKIHQNPHRKSLFKEIFPAYWRIFDQMIPECRVAPPTMHVEVRSDCSYVKTPVIQTFEPQIGIASGLSAPKILTYRTSDGKSHRMLVKGGTDDLRQDAIMEQVFEQVNALFQKSRTTRQRKLGIRTYKVVPLSTNCGLIEFVGGTVSLRNSLVPAHASYRPKDWTFSECQRKIHGARQKSYEDKVKAFEAVMNHFQPIMRFFFFHEFIGPDEWFSKRITYARSTAAISIVGHILGLGDRHPENILFDKRSGEVVHIDFGIAFEQGRVIPIPEIVPFRLTRDIVDGMGITNTKGVFQRCCELISSMLRAEASSVMAILNVLRYDPLYSWTISPGRAKDIQPKGDKKTTITAEADRALTIVAKKLKNPLSVQAEVNNLITEATDEKKLAVMYAG